MPPPPWTNHPSGIPLKSAPICKYCAEDLTVLEEEAPCTPPQTPPPPSPLSPFRSLPKWMATLPSNRTNKPVPPSAISTHTPPPFPPDSNFTSSAESSSTGFILTRSLSANVQAKAVLRHKTSSASMTRMKSLKRKYAGRALPYMRELSAVFSDHKRKEDLRSRKKRKRRDSDEGHNNDCEAV